MKQIITLIIILFLANGLFGRDYQVGDHELFAMPTAYTMPAGNTYFTDYELVFLNFTFAPTNRTHVGFFTLFPVVTEFLDTFSIGAKQNYLRTESLESAAWLAYTAEIEGFSIGNVLSISKENSSIHLGISGLKVLNAKKWEYLFMFGGKMDISERTACIVEYETTNSVWDNDFSKFISLGVRFKGERVAWDIAGVRPLAEDTGNLLFLPYIKATVYFSK
ncbi:MAG: hypothetical protein P9L97_05245 [Candidatus Tenebribacter davisii]|nr:hypothetical protein [Candidatus Tenebribacter davisii]